MAQPVLDFSTVEPTGLPPTGSRNSLPLRILSLDGGGVRGYSILILLQELMYHTYVRIHGEPPKRYEALKPCDHFDLIAGTGTGGLIAILLGRLRLDIATCKDIYVRMTKRVFETNEILAGIVYKPSLFKSSKLAEVIRETVQENTLNKDERAGEGIASNRNRASSVNHIASTQSQHYLEWQNKRAPQRYIKRNVKRVHARNPFTTTRYGDPNALLYDKREFCTKTAVTAMYKGALKDEKAVLLRSYDSRAEPAPEAELTIWEAGCATCATTIAFSPIQIGQSIFADEGAGEYNPAPQILDEAVCNEWPKRDVGVFVSIGTGKRPQGLTGPPRTCDEFAFIDSTRDASEAQERFTAKIEACEDIHQYMLKEHLAKRGVSQRNYYRLNVDRGMSGFGIGEWDRLAEISTSTWNYVGTQEARDMNREASLKLARIYLAKKRLEIPQPKGRSKHNVGLTWCTSCCASGDAYGQRSNPVAVELPAGSSFFPMRTR